MKVTVITINYNNEAGLKRTMQSVFNQTVTDLEYIVIDGGSTDGSKAFIEEHQAQLSYWLSEKDNGVYDAMNKGIQKANGNYLLFLNSGDYLCEKNTIETVFPFLGNADIVYGNMKIDEGGHLKNAFMPPKIDLKQMMNDTLWHPVSFIKRALFLEYGLFSTRYKICSDYDFFFKVVIAKHASLMYVNRFIVVFNLDGMSSDLKNVPIIQEEKKQIQATYLTQEAIESFWEKNSKESLIDKIKRWFR